MIKGKSVQYSDLKIAIVDDNSDNIRFLEALLNKQGVSHVRSYRSGSAFERSAKQNTYDIVFLDNQVDTIKNLYDLVSELVYNETLPPMTRLVYMAKRQSAFDYACEYPFHSNQLLEVPYTPQDLANILKEHTLQVKEFKLAYQFIRAKKFKNALLKLKELRNQEYPNYLKKARNQLLVNLLLKLGHYSLAKKLLLPLAERNIQWAKWSLFHVNYELKDFEACKGFLSEPQTRQDYPVRVFYWQIYIAFQTDNRDLATAQVLAFPIEDMSLSMFRLSLMVLHVCKEHDAIDNLSRRKERAYSEDPALSTLLSALSIKIRFLETLDNKKAIEPKVLKSIQTDLKTAITRHASNMQKYCSDEFNLLLIMMMLLEGKEADASAKLLQLSHSVLDDPSTATLVAYLFFLVKDMEHAREMLFNAHRALGKQHRNSHYVLAGLMHREVFAKIYQEESEQQEAYMQFASRLFDSGEYKDTIKMCSKALRSGINDQALNDLLLRSSREAGLKEQDYIHYLQQTKLRQTVVS
nr:response regulator [Pseudoalteromonas luteoviolacea]